MFNSFRDMPVWQNAHKLATEVYTLTINLPKSEDYSLTSQIRRSSNSIPANIAEGFGRKTIKDKVNFYVISRGSAFETQNHLIYGNAVGYFASANTDQLLGQYDNLIFEINKIISSLSQPKP